jgi:hypothetical protein
MRDPLLSTALGAALGEQTTDTTTDTAGAAPAPANRAARRGRAGKQTPSGTIHAGSGGRARAAQGRRINPVRRTG